MGKLLLFEIKKNIIKRSLLFLLIGFMALNFYKHWESVRYEGIFGFSTAAGEKSSTQKMMCEFYGEITEEKIREIQAYSEKMESVIASGNYDTQNPSSEFYTGYAFGDNNTIGEIKREVRAAYLYPNEMTELREKADKCIDFYEGRNEYEIRKNQLIKSMYGGRKISVYSDFGAAELYLNYEFSTFLIMVLMIFVFSSVFSQESFTGTDKIISSAGRGSSSFWAKHLSMYIFAAVLTVFFSLTDIISFGSCYDLHYLEQPLYSINSYRLSPYNFTILGAIMLSCLFKAVSLIFAGEVIFTISSFTKNSGASMALCFAAISIMIFLDGHIPDWMSPFSLFSAKKLLVEFKCMNIFGVPVLQPFVTLFFTVVYIGVLHSICYSKTALNKVKKGVEANAAV